MDHLNANGIHAIVQQFGFQVLDLAWPELRNLHATQVRHQLEASDALVTVELFCSSAALRNLPQQYVVWSDCHDSPNGSMSTDCQCPVLPVVRVCSFMSRQVV